MTFVFSFNLGPEFEFNPEKLSCSIKLFETRDPGEFLLKLLGFMEKLGFPLWG